ncbi:MAG: DegQ family serine endoprotease [Calditrichia bacterium]
MSKKSIRGYGLLLVLCGVVIGLVLASGLGVSNNLVASPDAPAAPMPSPVEPSMMTMSNAFADVAEKVNPAVVTISTETLRKSRQGNPFSGSPFEDFFRNMVPNQDQRMQGLGSGVIVKSSGIILTNNHVIDKADNIKVRLLDGSEYEAEVKGTDPRTDLAVLQIKASNLPSVEIGNSDAMRVGEWVMAIGSPLQAEFASTVTAGIVSAKGRTGVGLTVYEDFIQTDAAINPGNSGGALVNLKGELIGINTAIASRSGGSIGIGFAIPSNLANKIMNDIVEKGKVVRGWLGVGIGEVTPGLAEMYDLPNDEGVLINQVLPNGPAEKAGMEAGDLITAINGKRLKNPTELTTKIGSTAPGTAMEFTIYREGDKRTINVTLDEYKDDAQPLANAQSDDRAYDTLGLELRSVDNNLRQRFGLRRGDQGVVITSIEEGSSAERAGLQVGDLIHRLNRNSINSLNDFMAVMSKLEPGQTVAMYLKRDGRRLFTSFELPR